MWTGHTWSVLLTGAPSETLTGSEQGNLNDGLITGLLAYFDRHGIWTQLVLAARLPGASVQPASRSRLADRLSRPPAHRSAPN